MKAAVYSKKFIPVIIIVLILLASGVGFWFWSQKKSQEPVDQVEEKGVVGTAKDISESVPEIETNAGEKVPEINPLDRANPFKYENPLR